LARFDDELHRRRFATLQVVTLLAADEQAHTHDLGLTGAPAARAVGVRRGIAGVAARAVAVSRPVLALLFFTVPAPLRLRHRLAVRIGHAPRLAHHPRLAAVEPEHAVA